MGQSKSGRVIFKVVFLLTLRRKQMQKQQMLPRNQELYRAMLATTMRTIILMRSKSPLPCTSHIKVQQLGKSLTMTALWLKLQRTLRESKKIRLWLPVSGLQKRKAKKRKKGSRLLYCPRMRAMFFMASFQGRFLGHYRTSFRNVGRRSPLEHLATNQITPTEDMNPRPWKTTRPLRLRRPQVGPQYMTIATQVTR